MTDHTTSAGDWWKARQAGLRLPEHVLDTDQPECPFCGDEFDPDRIDAGVAFGICHECREMVAVEVGT